MRRNCFCAGREPLERRVGVPEADRVGDELDVVAQDGHREQRADRPVERARKPALGVAELDVGRLEERLERPVGGGGGGGVDRGDGVGEQVVAGEAGGVGDDEPRRAAAPARKRCFGARNSRWGRGVSPFATLSTTAVSVRTRALRESQRASSGWADRAGGELAHEVVALVEGREGDRGRRRRARLGRGGRGDGPDRGSRRRGRRGAGSGTPGTGPPAARSPAIATAARVAGKRRPPRFASGLAPVGLDGVVVVPARVGSSSKSSRSSGIVGLPTGKVTASRAWAASLRGARAGSGGRRARLGGPRRPAGALRRTGWPTPTRS